MPWQTAAPHAMHGTDWVWVVTVHASLSLSLSHGACIKCQAWQIPRYYGTRLKKLIPQIPKIMLDFGPFPLTHDTLIGVICGSLHCDSIEPGRGVTPAYLLHLS